MDRVNEERGKNRLFFSAYLPCFCGVRRFSKGVPDTQSTGMYSQRVSDTQIQQVSDAKSTAGSRYENLLTDDQHDFVARVSAERSLSVRDICQSAVERGGSDINAAVMEHAVELFHKEMAYRLCDGFSVNTSWYNASVHIRGVFNSPTASFDPAKHSVAVEFRQGVELRRELAMVGAWTYWERRSPASSSPKCLTCGRAVSTTC